MIPPASTYEDERRAFLRAAEQAGARLEHVTHPLRGPDGLEVATDVARLGAPPGEAHTVVVVASGTHGVEGHAGSGLQRLLLADGDLAGLAPGVAVLVVHGVNPWGWAWERRVDHQNVDVNRNFVDFAAPLPANDRYADVDPVLNPTRLDPDDQGWVAELLAFAEEVGWHEAFRVLSGGQYTHPHGVQFGGQAPTWSRTTLEGIWARHLRGAATAIHLDVHTGLGPCGVLTLFQTADADDASAEAGSAWFPSVLRSDRPVAGEGFTQGVLGPGLEAAVADVPLIVPVVVEFGTRDDMTVFGAMRVDNWVHQHGQPASEAGHAIRERMRDAFFVDDDAWRSTVAEQGRATVRAALDAAATRPA